MELKNQGVKLFQGRDTNGAQKTMGEALDEMTKIKSPNQESKTLQGNICQNMALVYKQTDDFTNSLKMSEKALEADSTNWKAMTNKADIKSNFIHKLKGASTALEDLVIAYRESLKSCEEAYSAPKADKKSIDPIKHKILLKLAQVSKDPEEQMKAASDACQMSVDQ